MSTRIRSGFEDDRLPKLQSKLGTDLVAWRKLQFSMFPELAQEPTFDEAVDLAAPETAKLHLPSSFTQEYRLKYGMEDLAQVEWSLRHGQAYDALEKLRSVIRTWNVNFNFKKQNVRGQSANTRAQQYLKTLTDDKKAAAEKYTRAQNAMASLFQSDVTKSKAFKLDENLLELRHEDLWGKDTSRPSRTGEQRTEEPWFWNIGGSKEGSSSWTIERQYLDPSSKFTELY